MNGEKLRQYALSGAAIVLFGVMIVLTGTKMFTVPFPCGLGNPMESEPTCCRVEVVDGEPVSVPIYPFSLSDLTPGE